MILHNLVTPQEPPSPAAPLPPQLPRPPQVGRPLRARHVRRQEGQTVNRGHEEEHVQGCAKYLP